ncbi:MAG TPA: DnaJ domain-containing protein [Erythrobacter sp.]|nr:DnaJ domain-containing protein [Erythrobacter sp.]
MESGREFIDYYAVLQVSPSADAKILEKAYRHFAQMYHPDHAKTADIEKFQAVIEAYNVLRNAEKRAAYDTLYKSEKKRNFHSFARNEETWIDEQDALSDEEMHQKMLFYLYKKRREYPDDPGVIGYHIQQIIGCSEESFDFHVWYLKSKGFINVTEHGTLAITVEGVDHVIAMSRTIEAEKLLIGQVRPNGEG